MILQESDLEERAKSTSPDSEGKWFPSLQARQMLVDSSIF